MNAVWTLVERELVRFFRQKNRIAGAIGQPLIFWILFGTAFKASFQPPGSDETYSQFFLPGIAVLIVLFTAIFSTISIIEDRREGFLQGVLVAPVSRSVIVLGKILGGSALAVVQAALFLLLAPLAGVPLGFIDFFAAVAVLFVIAFALCGLGFCIAWRMDSTQGFHAIMSVFLLPLWLLSGAVFPAAGLDAWLALLLKINPLSYGVSALRHALDMGEPVPGWGVSLLITALFALVTFLGALAMAGRRAAGDLR